MSELSDLYQQVILDHNRQPRNYQKLAGANRTAEGYNPLCGDQITVYLRLEDGVVRGVSFEGSGCAISKASASMMTAALKGKTAAEAATLFKAFHAMVTADPRRDIRSPLNLESSPPSPACTSFPFESNAPPCRGTPCGPRSRAGRRPFRRSRRWTPRP